jgi:16S rRNA (adenine1518-N6/adenine1519-N6)-dimethyltransferase
VLVSKKTKKAHSAATAHGIPLKKQYGQHFLRVQSVIDHMIDAVALTPESSVFEIGCGDGFLTRSILQASHERLWVFEIDPQWADHVEATYCDKRMTLFRENILEVDFARFASYAPWVLLANLPYQVTFAILKRLREHRLLVHEGVIMVQEEVAQKITASGGRSYGFISLYFQHFFLWRLLDKVAPDAFYPPPKVYSRLLYFKPYQSTQVIAQEDEFWVFIKRCFTQPRRTLRNNLQSYHYALDRVSQELLSLRAQQLDKDQLLSIWYSIIS